MLFSTEEVTELLAKGNKHRTQEPTAANKESSRSHAVLQVRVCVRAVCTCMCLYVCVCMYVCMYACMYGLCMYVCDARARVCVSV